MYCPVCKDERLAISDKNGIEIDYCPKCRGIWLDRGELEKIIERAQSHYSHQTNPNSHNNYERKYSDYEHKRYKKESFWSELFD